jgi:protein-tyrosine phosphatase
MHPKELRHYAKLNLGASNLIELYEKAGFKVRHLPWEDPLHRLTADTRSFQGELMQIRADALAAFDALPKPVLLHCSAGQDRSSPVAAYIFVERDNRHGT